MGKQDVEEEGIMKVEAQQRHDDLENSNEEDDRQLLLLPKSDTEILLGLLPARVWMNVNNVLLDDHLTGDLKNLTNASPFFRDLMYSKGVLFLLPEVFKIIGPQLENEERSSSSEKSSILTCRLVCKSWNKSVDHYIDASRKPDFFQPPPPLPTVPRDPVLTTARYKYFGFMAPQRLEHFLEYFDQSHQSTSGTQRSPFIGTTVTLCNDLYCRKDIQVYDKAVTLLGKYGQHIRIMTLGVLRPISDQYEDYLWLKQCLELTPNLTHLKLRQRPITEEDVQEKIEMDSYFGEHAYRTVATAEYLRRRVFEEMDFLAADVRQIVYDRLLELHQGNLMKIPADERDKQNYDIDEHLSQNVRTLGYEARGPEPFQIDARVPTDLHVDENVYCAAIARDPLPVLKNLECLKLCKLSARLFNPLIQSNRQIIWLHIELRGHGYFDWWHWIPNTYMDWWTLDFPNLKKLHVKFSGGPEEVRRLRYCHSSLLKLTSLHFEYPAYMGWGEIFQILEHNWASTLTELKIRLPEPYREDEKKDVKNACEHGKLALPKLKRLVMWKSGQIDAIRNFLFLSSIRENLEEFVVL